MNKNSRLRREKISERLLLLGTEQMLEEALLQNERKKTMHFVAKWISQGASSLKAGCVGRGDEG